MTHRFDTIMVRLAEQRTVVSLADGRSGRLVAWKPHNNRGFRRINVARVEFPGGGRATVNITDVVGLIDDDGEVFPLPADTPQPLGDNDE